MSNQITPNPSVPSQVVADGLKFPKFISNLGIIPTSYKDSMSYYECLAWLCKYLEETVIPTVNENGEAVEELQGLYIQLNEYVTHYFDNLDVQEEINNKLDEMTTTGQLQQIVSSFFGNLENQINALSSRMDTFTNLPNGSTSGDAELQDIRVGYTGQTWANAGDAVRGQAKNLRDRIDKIAEQYSKTINIYNYLDFKNDGKYYKYDTGEIATQSNWGHVDYIEVEPLTKYYYNQVSQVCYWNSSKEYLSGVVTYNNVYETPANTKYITVSSGNNIIQDFLIMKSQRTLLYQYFPYLYQLTDKIRITEDNIEELTDFINPLMLKFSSGANSLNKFNKNVFVRSNTYFNADGEEVSQSNWGYAKVEPISEGLQLGFSHQCFVCAYDETDTFIEGKAISNNVVRFDVPADTKYLIVSLQFSREDILDNFQIYTSFNPQPPYTNYQYMIDNNIIARSFLSGKNVLCIGDSLTYGADASSTRLSNNYPCVISHLLGCNVINCGFPGASGKSYYDERLDLYPIDENIDIVTIMLGTNQGLTDTLDTDVFPYDDYEDYADNNTGCYCKIIESVMEKTNNKAQIVLMTPPINYYDSGRTEMVINASAVIRKIADYYCLPLIDNIRHCGINKFNADVFMPTDNLHCNAIGYNKLGSYIASQLNSMFSNNYILTS